MRELNQDPKVGSNQEISAPDGSYNQVNGTLASKILLIASKISGVMMMVPSIARMTSLKHFLTKAITLYILATS